MVFGNGVKNIHAAAYNGARTVLKMTPCYSQRSKILCNWVSRFKSILPLKKPMEFSENNTLHRTVRRRIMTGSQSAFLALLLPEPRVEGAETERAALESIDGTSSFYLIQPTLVSWLQTLSR